MIASIDWETTGLECGFHDGIEFACVLLDDDLTPLNRNFTCIIKPKYGNVDPRAMAVNKMDIEAVKRDGLEGSRAAELFTNFLQEETKNASPKVTPLAKNYPFDRGFSIDWLGHKLFETLFFYRHRDLQPVLAFMNDRAKARGGEIPFPKLGLQDVRAKLGIEVKAQHRAFDDAMLCARVYKELTTW